MVNGIIGRTTYICRCCTWDANYVRCFHLKQPHQIHVDDSQTGFPGDGLSIRSHPKATHFYLLERILEMVSRKSFEMFQHILGPGGLWVRTHRIYNIEYKTRFCSVKLIFVDHDPYINCEWRHITCPDEISSMIFLASFQAAYAFGLRHTLNVSWHASAAIVASYARPEPRIRFQRTPSIVLSQARVTVNAGVSSWCSEGMQFVVAIRYVSSWVPRGMTYAWH